MSIAKSKEEFEKASEGLPFFQGLDLQAEVLCIEPIDGKYFRTSQRQRCIIRREGTLFVTFYD